VEGIFGRDLELAAMERFLDGAPTWPSAVLIEGEAGIGKTTLWQEGLRRAQERSIRTLHARPAESEQKLSYVALTDLVVEAFDEVGSVLPRVQQRALAGALVQDEPGDESSSARTTATAFIGVLAACAAKGAVLLAVDDVQWLDSASAQTLAFALRRLPPKVGVLLSHRVDAGQEPPLGLPRALPENRLLRIAPGPLSLAALHHMVKSRFGTVLPRPLLARLADACGGNPFYALEMARVLVSDRDLKPAQPLPLPHNLEELVVSRVESLSAPAWQLALAAAATSQPTRSVLAAALPMDADFGAALLEAEEEGVLTSKDDRIRFQHPLLASVIYGSASAERRRQLHERLALVVLDPEERARHLALCTTEPDEEIAAELEAAAGLAARRGAPEAAAELFSAAKRLTPPAREDELTGRGLGEAKALLAAGDVDGARKIASEAANASAVGLRVEAELLLGDIAWIGGSWAGAIEHLENAIAAEPEDAALAARAYPKLVNYSTHDPTKEIERAERALAALSSQRVPAAVASVAFDLYWAEILLGHGARRELFERWEELEEQAGPDASKSVIPLIYFHSIDDFGAARHRYAVEAEWYRVRGEEGWAAERLAHLGFVEFRAGRWELAERLVEEACIAIAQLERPGPWTTLFRLRSFVDAGRGRTARARTTLLPLIDEANRFGRTVWESLFLSTLAFVEFADDDHAAVDAALTRMYRCTKDTGIQDLVPDRSEPFQIESLVALGEVERARGALARLEERGRVFPRLWIDVTLPRARAIVLAAEGELEKAFAALDALDPTAAAKLPFDLAWTLLVRGRLHRRAKQRHAAAEVLRTALEQFQQLGAPSWIERTRAELDRVGLRRAPTELTATERRVAELAASGLTNREVASKAFMSPKTVQANLARVYRKLGISSRAELGARMSEERGR